MDFKLDMQRDTLVETLTVAEEKGRSSIANNFPVNLPGGN